MSNDFLRKKWFVSKPTEREAIISKLVELIQTERLQQELSINEVATRAGLSRAMVMRVEKRERLPTIETLLRIASALDIQLSALLLRAEKAAGRSKR